MACLASGPAAAQATLVDRAVAVAEDRVLTASEIRIAATLARLDPGGLDVLDPGGEDPVRWWLQQVGLRQLAGDSEVYQPASGEVRERVEQLLGLDEAQASLEQLTTELGLSRSGLEAWMYNRLVVERYVLRNLGPEATDAARIRETYRSWVQDQARGLSMRRIGPVTPQRPQEQP